MSTGVVIRLRNLPVSAGTIDIRRFFSTLSIPDGGVHIIGGEDGTAFILFTTDEDARQAMLRDGQKISGDKVKLMLSSHTEMRLMIEESQRRYEELRGLRPPEPPITNLTSRSSATGGGAQKGQAQPDTADTVSDLYCEMKGMPYNVSEEDIVEFFQHLPISAIRFMRDEKGRQSGQGFVKFKSPTSKQQALKKDRDFLGPRFVRVIPATERQWVSSGSQMCDTVRPSTDEYSRKRGQNSTPSNEGTPKRSRALSPIRCDNCVELRGLPVTSSYKTVQDLFYHLKFVEGGLFLELDGKHCRGRAFAEFSTIEEYKEALLKDGEMIEGKQIRVISISRQVMAEQIKQHKKYLKMKREEEYKREREEIEHKERLKERQMKEAQYEEQKRKDEEEQKKRREYQMKKQREMEEWLARQHAKEEEERKRRELDRLFEQRRMQEEEDRARRAALEEKRRREEDELRRKEEAEMRAEFERKRQIELQRLEAKIKEEAEMRIKQEYMKKELESMNQNGNVKEVEMDLEDQNPSPAVPKEEYVEDYPPPPSDALLPVKPATSQYSSASSDSGFSQFSRGSSGTPQLRPGEPPLTSHASVHPYQPMAYQHRFTPPPPLPSPGTTPLNPPALPPSTALPPPSVAPLKLPTAPAVIIAATPPPQMLTSLPPPPLPPSIGLGPVVRLPRAPNPALPPRIPTQTGSVVAPATLPPPNGRLPPTLSTTEARPPAPQMRPPQPNDPNIPTKFVRIANSPFTISEHMIREFFHGLPIAPHGVQFVIKNGKRSGHIFIKFMHEVDAERASRQDKGHLGGREVLVQKTNPTQMTQLLRKFESRNLEDLFPLSDFAGTATANYKPQPPGGATGLPPKPSHRDDLNLEMNILVDKLTCVRLGSVPPHTIPEDIMRAFSGISIMPNGIHILHTPDGKCNGNAFVELVTSEDCVRAANLHAVAQIHGSLIRIMPVRNGEMEKEIMDHNMKVFGRPPHGPPLPSNLPPPHPDELRLQMPPSSMPDLPRGPMDMLGPRPPPPVRFPEYDLALRHPEIHGPRFNAREPPRPSLPPMEPPGGGRNRGRSPTPPHMQMHRGPSPRNMPPMRPRSPPRGMSPGHPMGRRSPSPSMRPPPREMSRQEMEHRAEMDDLNRRIDHERAMLRERELAHRRPPFDMRPPFPPGGPRLDRPPFPGDGPRFPPGMPPPRFMGDMPMRPRLPMDMPPFRMPMHGPVPVKMSNLSFHITQEDILEFFMKFSPIPDSVRLMYNPIGKLTGEGLVAFPSREAAEAAMSDLNQKMLLNRKIKLVLA